MEISELKKKLLEYVQFMDRVGELKSFKGFIIQLIHESSSSLDSDLVYAIREIDRDERTL